jgi:hypothetical protein
MKKVCSKCGEEKSLDKFTKNKACKEGRTNLCRGCANMMQSKFRLGNREYVNLQAKGYGYKKHPERLVKLELVKSGHKKCSRCGDIFEFKEFRKTGAICYKCRTGHERGIYENKNDNGRYKKRFTIEEQKIKSYVYAKKWAELNPEKRKLIDKKSKSRPVYRIKQREWAKKYYHLNPNRESIERYNKSEKGIAASHKAKVKWQDNNPEKRKEISRRQVTQLNDCYVINKLRRQAGGDIGAKEIRKYPELIETKKIQLKLRRLLNEKCNRTA